MVLTDLDYADDISLRSDNMEQAQELLHRVELECAKVGLRLNAKKTEVYNVPPEHQPLITAGGTVLKEVEDFKYLGSWVNSTDLKVRKALAWRALNSMTSVWNSNLPRQTKLSFFYATVESVLLYGSECWTLKPTLEKSLDGGYTRMLRAVLNINKSVHVTNRILYKGIPRVREKIGLRRMRLAGHHEECRSPEHQGTGQMYGEPG